LVDEINKAENNNQEQIRFRNLVMFVLGVNLPLKTNDFLELKYRDLFNDNDCIKPIEYSLGRFHKDEIINVPLRACAKQVLLAYTKKYGMSYTENAQDALFQSRKHQTVSLKSWWYILNDAVKNVGIEKNIGAESLRKTYGLNVYSRSLDKLNALVFLGDLWGQARESQIIKYLNLIDGEIDFDYYFGESFSLGEVNLSKIECLQKSKVTETKKEVSPKEVNKEKTTKKIENKKLYREWTKEKKLEVVNKYFSQKITMKELAKEYGLDGPIISRWVNAYRDFGESAFEDKRRKENQGIENKNEVALHYTEETKSQAKIQHTWTGEKKLEIIYKYLTQDITIKELEREYGVSHGYLSQWLSAYRKYGEKAFDDMKKTE